MKSTEQQTELKSLRKVFIYKHSGSIPRNACVACETELCVTTKKVWLADRQTHAHKDRRRTKWSLCAAMLRRRHNNAWNGKIFAGDNVRGSVTSGQTDTRTHRQTLDKSMIPMWGEVWLADRQTHAHTDRRRTNQWSLCEGKGEVWLADRQTHAHTDRRRTNQWSLCEGKGEVWLADRQTHAHTDAGQSDPYVSLCFAGDTKIGMRQKPI